MGIDLKRRNRMKTRVFVSYTSKDPLVTDERLKQVESRLKPFATVFIDRLHNKKGGQCRVNYELWRSDVLLQLVSNQHQSEWVQKELLAARKKDKPVIKVRIDEFLKIDQEHVYLLLSDVDKKGWSVWSILIVSLLVCVGVSLVGLWLSYMYVAGQVVSSSGEVVQNARGLFGDSWGGVNAIISAFAFAGVIVTLFLQNRDLNLQRKEMARQREEFEKENKTLKYQRFENLFYNMLNLQQEIVAGLRYDYQEKETFLIPQKDSYPLQDDRLIDKVVTGREVFRYTFEDAQIALSEKDKLGNSIIIQGYRRFMHIKGFAAYDYTWIPTIYDHYFRHLYKIIQFVDKQGFSFEEAYKYVSLLRGTLSRYELVWIFYNALSFEKFKILIEKYALLKNLREDLLARSAETESFYKDLGLNPNDLPELGVSGKDYEMFLTDNPNDITKYYLTAFCKSNETEAEQDRLNRWRTLVGRVAE